LRGLDLNQRPLGYELSAGLSRCCVVIRNSS
jgi:hypothetical protein